jgi:hypothetical protein
MHYYNNITEELLGNCGRALHEVTEDKCDPAIPEQEALVLSENLGDDAPQ